MTNFFFDTGELDLKFIENSLPPLDRNSPGVSGQFAYDEYNFYICTSGDGTTGIWKSAPLINNWSN